MEHPYVFVSVLFFGSLFYGALFFWLGQKSVVLVGQRVESMKTSENRQVMEYSVVQPDKVRYAPVDGDAEPTMFAPPKYAELVKNYQKGGDK